MPAYHIDGPSGSGKSAAGKVLANQGYRIVDPDTERGLSAWVERSTGKRLANRPKGPRTEEWLKTHSWNWDPDMVRRILAAHEDEHVFFCGCGSNQREFYHLFTKRFGLYTDNETRLQRLRLREPKRWTDGSIEVARVIARNISLYKETASRNGVVLIDSTGSPEEVAEAILREIFGDQVTVTPPSAP